MSPNKVSVVLVHGAWADGSSWSKIVPPLAAEGVEALAASLPLTSLEDDVAALERTLERTSGPVVLAAHAYGGVVASALRSDKVKALVYVAAVAPDEGESALDLLGRSAPHPEAPQLAPDGRGEIFLPGAAFAAAFAPDASAAELAVLAAVQRPVSLACIAAALPPPLWKERPCWFLVAERDRMITEDKQRFMATRMRARLRSHPVDHTPMVTAPGAVAEVLREAIAAVRSDLGK